MPGELECTVLHRAGGVGGDGGRAGGRQSRPRACPHPDPGPLHSTEPEQLSRAHPPTRTQTQTHSAL